MLGNYYPGFCRSEKKAVCQKVLGTPPFLLYLLMIRPIPILHYQLDFELKEKLQEIEQQLKMYEDDKAEELLNQLIEWLEREE